MANLKDWIEKEAGGQDIIGCVIGETGWGDYKSDFVPGYVDHVRGKVLAWEKAIPQLSYEFDAGHGAPGCEAIYAWTKDWVIFVVQYDGATWPTRVPRNPVDIMPDMPGG